MPPWASPVIEPAVAPHQALQAHLELSDIPIIDKGTLTVLGNDDFLLSLLRDDEGPAAVADYVGSALAASNGLGVKCINAGGATAFKYNVRAFSLDDVVPFYDLTSRKIVEALQRAIADLKVPHPVHLHCNNIGIPGNVSTAIATIAAAQGKPLHLAHLQFYAYGGRRRTWLFVRRRRPRCGGQRRAECHGRCWPGHVPADGDNLLRCAAAVQRRRHGQAQEIRETAMRTAAASCHTIIERTISSMRCNGLAGSNCFFSSMIRGRYSSRRIIQMARHSRPIRRFSR